MRLYVIFGQRAGFYPGEYAPEVLDCWDETSLEENPDGYFASLDKHRANKSFCNVEEMILEVPDEAVDKLFETPVTKAKVVEAKEEG